MIASGEDNALTFLRERYKDKTEHKVEVTKNAYNKDLVKAQKELDKAQEAFDEAPFGREDKAEKKLQEAQAAFDAIKAESEFWGKLHESLKSAQDWRKIAVLKIHPNSQAYRLKLKLPKQKRTLIRPKPSNYKMGHVQIGNFDISIENPAGSERKGVDANGKPWTTKMVNTYGYMRGTEGVDGDHIDVFLANDMDAWNGRKVFVVDQYNEDGSFDEHKVMLGFNEQEDAEAAYFANYEKDWGKKHKTVVTAVNLEDFEKWIDSSHRKTKAFAEYKNINGRANNPSEPIVKAGTIFKNNEAGGDAVA